MNGMAQLTRHVEHLIADIVDTHAGSFSREEWRVIFDVVLTGLFGDGTDDDREPGQ